MVSRCGGPAFGGGAYICQLAGARGLWRGGGFPERRGGGGRRRRSADSRCAGGRGRCRRARAGALRGLGHARSGKRRRTAGTLSTRRAKQGALRGVEKSAAIALKSSSIP